jgi:hypothetical protein
MMGLTEHLIDLLFAIRRTPGTSAGSITSTKSLSNRSFTNTPASFVKAFNAIA